MVSSKLLINTMHLTIYRMVSSKLLVNTMHLTIYRMVSSKLLINTMHLTIYRMVSSKLLINTMHLTIYRMVSSKLLINTMHLTIYRMVSSKLLINIMYLTTEGKRLVGWLVVFYVPSTEGSFRDGTPIYCPLRRTLNSVNTPFLPGIEPRAVAWQSITLPLRKKKYTHVCN